MLVIEYDHRSFKALLAYNSAHEFAVLTDFVKVVKAQVPKDARSYNPDNRVWFMTAGYIQLVRDNSKHLDVSWEKRI